MTTSGASDLFLGTWDLLPELCLYDEGTPPDQADYEIGRAGGGLRLRITWRPAGSASSLSTGFGGPDDGTVQPVEGQAGVTGLSLLRIDDRTLDSTAWNEDAVVSSARRVASADGTLLVVRQVVPGAGGGSVQTFQVYARRSAARPAEG